MKKRETPTGIRLSANVKVAYERVAKQLRTIAKKKGLAPPPTRDIAVTAYSSPEPLREVPARARLLGRLPGIGDPERGAQPLVEFRGGSPAVPSAPGERTCFVFRVGRDHQAQPGLGVLDGPECSPRSRARHGDPPCALFVTPAR